MEYFRIYSYYNIEHLERLFILKFRSIFMGIRLPLRRLNNTNGRGGALRLRAPLTGSAEMGDRGNILSLYLVATPAPRPYGRGGKDIFRFGTFITVRLRRALRRNV